MKESQKKLINSLYETLIKINEEGLNDDQFYEWISENYFFENNLEEIIHEIKKAKTKIKN
ncbi:hypothetical protein SAMN04488598_1555 [Halanaerobium congolense]|jgi:hypothetical protein|uniref:Uncharacterized protein n=1 Tax=Halanaerobium congolense TaxID=54121 RepID=A0A1I0CE00_9FIRM|nr:hypothetical protein [Halanaerobium congolense]SDG16906.1 hypothetical protein SAMN04488598_1555 [Halanaerobium congolense]SET17798.1 hypothetical protein SAMN04515652_1358 [Halanaerobium congolense]SFP67771.1 hypothetical protein SAMN04488596_1398 [Halanaerobium congolense]